MTWNVPHQHHRVFERNPLVAVLVELRFHPILKIIDRIADVQEKVRATFPAFRDVTRQLVDVTPANPVEVRSERLFHFSKADGSSSLALSTSSISLDSRRHDRRETFIADAMLGIDALNEICGPIAPTRVGLRYVDLVDKQRLEGDLGRQLEWKTIIDDRFLAVPTGLSDLEDTLFSSEVLSKMPSRGEQVVRHGLLRDTDQKVKFRLDVDRYLEASIETSELADMLAGFSDDIFAVFIAAMGPDLQTWMPEKRAS